MHPFEDVLGQVGITAGIQRVRGPPPDASRSLYAPQSSTVSILNAPRFITGALEGLLCTQ